METYSRRRYKKSVHRRMEMDQYCQQEGDKSTTTADLSPLLCKPSSDHSPPLIQEMADKTGESETGSHIVAGFLYEIDHVHLPARIPSQLRSVRVAMVCEKTNLNIAVRFPSMDSLGAFFNYSNRETHPALDEEFVMGKATAARVLVKIVPVDIYTQQKCLESFWLISSMAAEMCKDNGTDEEKKGSCFSVLKGNGMVTWGSRRQVKYLGRHQENECSDSVGGKSEEGIDVVGDDSGEGDQDEDDDQEIEEDEEENKANHLKRKRYPLRNRGIKKTKVEIRAVKKEKVEKNGRKTITKGRMRWNEAQVQRDLKFRWSAERYKLAEKNLLEVMKLKGATAEKPILRPELRVEARKKIGDTGLLDHLLKHMAGRLAPGGKDRFRRRHNPDGAMEYWLEKADLVDIRKDAGVKDPYWVPPPGWKPGDSPNQHPICATELKLLKDEFCKMKREMGLMATKMQMDEEVGKLRRKLEEINPKRKQEEYQAITTELPSSNVISQKLVELAASLVGDSPASMQKCKEQLMALSDFVKGTEGGMGKLTSNLEERGNADFSKPLGAVEEKAAKIQRLKSGFRICKPQGTFLWPNMVKDSTSMASQVVIQVEVPTPPSVSSSSASNPPQLILHHSHNTPALVKPLAEKRAVSVTTISQGTSYEDGLMNYFSSATSIDLNDAPNES